MGINIIQKPALHQTKGVIPRAVTGVVIHSIEGSLQSANSWFMSPKSQVSAHLGIGKDGSVVQWVSVHDIAWHAGIKLDPVWRGLKPGNPNNYTVGIEHEGDGKTPWTEAQFLSSAIMSAWLHFRFGIPVNTVGFAEHNWIRKSKTCPGDWFSMDNYLDRVAAVVKMHGREGIVKLIDGLR